MPPIIKTISLHVLLSTIVTPMVVFVLTGFVGWAVKDKLDTLDSINVKMDAFIVTLYEIKGDTDILNFRVTELEKD